MNSSVDHPSTSPRFELVYLGVTSGPFAPLEAASFVHRQRIPLNASVRIVGTTTLWPLSRFPVLAEASVLAARGRPLRPSDAGMSARGRATYTPNHLRSGERLTLLILGGALAGISVVGLLTGAIRFESDLADWRGALPQLTAMWLVMSGGCSLALACILAVIDLLDRANVTRGYRVAVGVLAGIGILPTVFGLGLGYATRGQQERAPVAIIDIDPVPLSAERPIDKRRSSAMSKSPFVPLPAARGHTPGTVYVVAARNCSRDEAQRADQLASDLRKLGIPVQRVSDISFPVVDSSQVARTRAVMEGRLPIVFVAGFAANNPALDEVLAQHSTR